MPDYATPFGRAGAATGTALGGLGRLLEPFDYPRQALWGLPGKLGEGDLLGALPGLAGVGTAGALALTGAGLPLAMLGGSLAGGLGQGIGRQIDEDRFEAPTPSHLIEALGVDPESLGGQALSFGAGALGDPLTYAGGLGGKAVGQHGGKYLEEVALTRGPGYQGGAEKILKHPQADRVNAMAQSPWAEALLGEVPPGSQPLGAGAEAITFRTPEGHVVRIAGGPGTVDVGRDYLEDSLLTPFPGVREPEMLPIARDVAVGPYRVQHMPHVEMAPGGEGRMDPVTMELLAASHEVRQALFKRGYAVEDLNIGNVGKTPAGRYVAVDPTSPLPGPNGAPPEMFTHRQGGPVSHYLLGLLGSDRTVRDELEASLRAGPGLAGVEAPEAARKAAEYRAQIEAYLPTARAERDALWEQAAARPPAQVRPRELNNLADRQAHIERLKRWLGLPGEKGVGSPMRGAADMLHEQLLQAGQAPMTPNVPQLLEAERARREMLAQMDALRNGRPPA